MDFFQNAGAILAEIDPIIIGEAVKKYQEKMDLLFAETPEEIELKRISHIIYSGVMHAWNNALPLQEIHLNPEYLKHYAKVQKTRNERIGIPVMQGPLITFCGVPIVEDASVGFSDYTLVFKD